jgi:hypothetical protein
MNLRDPRGPSPFALGQLPPVATGLLGRHARWPGRPPLRWHLLLGCAVLHLDGAMEVPCYFPRIRSTSAISACNQRAWRRGRSTAINRNDLSSGSTKLCLKRTLGSGGTISHVHVESRGCIAITVRPRTTSSGGDGLAREAHEVPGRLFSVLTSHESLTTCV